MIERNYTDFWETAVVNIFVDRHTNKESRRASLLRSMLLLRFAHYRLLWHLAKTTTICLSDTIKFRCDVVSATESHQDNTCPGWATARRCRKRRECERAKISSSMNSAMTNSVVYTNRWRETCASWRVLTSVAKASAILFHRAKNNKARDRMKHTDGKH